MNGFANEQALVDRLAALSGVTAITAARAISAALRHLGIKRLALGTPYPEAMSALGRACTGKRRDSRSPVTAGSRT